MTRNVLITGGSSGIGSATVRRFATAGDRVWFTYHIGEERARSLVQSLQQQQLEAQAFKLELGDLQSHENLLGALPGPVDVLINNAALGSKTVERYVPRSRHEQDLAFMRVGALGPLWLTEALLPGMLDRGYGKIVFVASVGGGVSQFPQFRIAEAMAKAAVAYLTRQLAAEMVHTPLDVVAVCPGAVDTPMFRASTLNHMEDLERKRFVAGLPKGRLIEPEEIAEVLWWLSTDVSQVMHGAVIDASMGLGVHPGLITGDSANMSSGRTT
jgi:NAD(P)-dependent dehydrogenase (short-subunit alcohol dehydrogenase family)